MSELSFDERYKRKSLEHLAYIERDDFKPDYVLLGTSMIERFTWNFDAKIGYEKYGLDKLNIANFGCGGYRMSHLKQKLVSDGFLEKLSKKCTPKKIIFEGGANDLEFGNPHKITTQGNNDDKSLKKLANIYKTILQEIRKCFPNTEIIIFGILPRFSNKFHEEIILERQKRFNEFIKENSDIDKYVYFGDKLMKDNSPDPSLYVDLVHLNQNGYNIFAEELSNTFSS